MFLEVLKGSEVFAKKVEIYSTNCSAYNLPTLEPEESP